MSEDSKTIDQKIGMLRDKKQLVDETWRKVGNSSMLELLVELIPKALQCDRCSIFVLDPSSDDVWVKCGTGLSEQQVSVPKATSLVGQVIERGESIVRAHLEDTAGAHELVDMRTGYLTRSAMVVPIHGVKSQRNVGAIQVLNKAHGKNFSEEDRAQLERVAEQISANVEAIFMKQELLKLSRQIDAKIRQLESMAR